MINFSHCSSSPGESFYSEVMGTEIVTRQIKLPRHISCWETKSHRNLEESNKIKRVSKTCSLNARKSQATNLAVNILKYQLRDRFSRQKHWKNIQDNLEHRLKKAQANGDDRLVSILQAEFRQLMAGIRVNH